MELPPPRDYVPFKAGPFRMAMGLNELNLNEWIEIDSNYPVEMAQKQKLLSENFDAVFAAQPGDEESSREVLEVLASHLARRFPDYFQREDSMLKNSITN